MPSDGFSDDDARSPRRRAASSGRTAYVPANRGRRLPAQRPAARKRRTEADQAGANQPGADELSWLNETAPLDDLSWRDETGRGDRPTGPNAPGPNAPGPNEPGPARSPGRPGTPVPLDETADQATATTTLAAVSAHDESDDQRSAVAAPPRAPRPAAPPTAPAPRRNRRWSLAAAVLLVAALVGASAAVLTNRDDDGAGSTAGPQAGQSGAAQTASPSGATPSGVAGLGPNPSASASTTPAAGFVPFPAPRKTLPGAALNIQGGESFSAALRRSDQTFGPLRMVRVFYPGLPPAWNGSRADVTNRTVVVSFKAPPKEISAGKHDSRLTSWFKSIPSNVDVYWTYFHEPENDVQRGAYTPAQFAAAFRHVSELADQARNPRLRATLILMCWTLNPNSGRNFDAYYPGSSAVDVLGWDCYNSGAQNNRYTPPSEVYSRMINKSRALGKPWGLAETGSIRIKGDSTGTGRAAWIRSMSRYLNDQRPLWVAYYDYKVSGGDYRLTDEPSRQAWKAWCSASPA